MSAYAERADRLSALAAEDDFDFVLVTNLVNVRYLCGFSGTNGVCLIGAGERAGERVFVTDFRYVERSRSEVTGYELVEGKRDLLGDVARLVSERGGTSPRLGFEDASMTVRQNGRLRELLGDGPQLVPAGTPVERLRAVKDAGELEAMRRAAALADGVYQWLVEEHGLAGHTERAVARALERVAQDRGAEDAAFPPIVAAAANGALPHALPRDVEIPRDTLVVVDFGCLLDGYHSDCTRTFATGDPGEEAREVYELVLSAQSAAREAVRAGTALRAVDAAAREPITAAGHGDRFGHGTGHGVGLEVHEEPRVTASVDGELELANVVTIEPGVYLPGRFGVRIEDLVAVEASGCELLTSFPRELVTV